MDAFKVEGSFTVTIGYGSGPRLIMALSIAFHLSRGEKGFTINIVALLLALFVAWGRSTA